MQRAISSPPSRRECLWHPSTLAAEGDGDGDGDGDMSKKRCPGPSTSIASARGILLGGWLERAVCQIQPGEHNNRQASLFLI